MTPSALPAADPDETEDRATAGGAVGELEDKKRTPFALEVVESEPGGSGALGTLVLSSIRRYTRSGRLVAKF